MGDAEKIMAEKLNTLKNKKGFGWESDDTNSNLWLCYLVIQRSGEN